ncbi:MAG: TetR/AcrR family transcriptional regulator C-terminal domain-containing protein [Propionibacteriaceae bacterium]|nr:TetR/AcrR family transcriptional regulator C-terminal domain-containing protein [Propionibacteriaceae bacterium]
MALTYADVVGAAVATLDTDGLEGLSMRRVAAALGVQPGALYHHVPDKQTLLAGMADQILADVEEPLGLWRPAVEAWTASLRAVLLAHRDSAELVATARGFRLSRHDTIRHPATLLGTAGLPAAQARGAASALLYFVLGHVAEEQARLDWERFHPADPALAGDADAAFALGVRLLLDGVSAQRAGVE